MSKLRTCQLPAAHSATLDECSVPAHWSTVDLIGHIHDLATAERPDLAAQLRADLAGIRGEDLAAIRQTEQQLAETSRELSEVRAERDTLSRRRSDLRSWLDEVAESSERLRALQDGLAAAAQEIYRSERDAFRNVAAFMDGQDAGTATRG